MSSDPVYWDRYDEAARQTVRYLPHRYGDGTYKLMPRSGRATNLAVNAVEVRSLNEVAERLRTGQYCLRMSPGGRGSAVRVCPPNITIGAAPSTEAKDASAQSDATTPVVDRRTSETKPRVTPPPAPLRDQAPKPSMSQQPSGISMGLVVRSPWIEKILSGEKTWEIRSKPNSTTGRIALCKGGGPIVGTCMIGRSIALWREEFRKHFDKHRVSEQQLVEFYGDRQVYAWPVSDVRPLSSPIRYKHPGGGSWVTLSQQNVSEFDALQRS